MTKVTRSAATAHELVARSKPTASGGSQLSRDGSTWHATYMSLRVDREAEGNG